MLPGFPSIVPLPAAVPPGVGCRLPLPDEGAAAPGAAPLLALSSSELPHAQAMARAEQLNALINLRLELRLFIMFSTREKEHDEPRPLGLVSARTTSDLAWDAPEPTAS